MIDGMLLNAVFISYMAAASAAIHAFVDFLLPHKTLSRPLAAFPHNHHGNDRQR